MRNCAFLLSFTEKLQLYQKITKKVLTYGYKRYIIFKHVKFCVEAKCGYILTGGGNFRGVCFGKDQAVSFLKISTYPKKIMQNLGFLYGDK